MAETVLRVILEGADKAEEGLGGVAKAYTQVGTAAKKSGDDTKKAFGDTVKEGEKLNDVLKNGLPKVDFKKPAQSIQELKTQIRQFTSDAIKAGEGTKAFATALQEAGKRKAELKDLQQAVAALDPDTKGKAFLQLSQTIITGFAAGTGALSAFGLSAEDAQKTLVKLQSALALGQFLGQVGELGDTFKILEVQIRNSAVAQRAFNLIANANPFVLLASVALAAYGAIQLFDTALKDDTEEFIKNNEVIKKANEERDRLRATLAGLAIDLAKEKGILTNSDASILKLIQAQNEKKIELGKVLGEESKKIDEQFAEQLKKAKIDRDEDEVLRLVRQKDKEKKAIQNSLQEEFKIFKAANEAKIKIIEAQFNKEEEAANKAKNEKIAAENKKKAQDNLKFLSDLHKVQSDTNDKADEELLKSQEDLNKKKEDLEKESTKKTIENIKAVNEVNAKGAAEDLANTESFLKTKFETNIKFAQATVDSLRAISSIAAAAGADTTEFTKVLAIAQIAINTAMSISNAIAGATAAATATGPGAVVFTPVFIATQIATVLGAVASAVAVLNSANIPRPNFWSGGYTGDGGKYDYAGTVHKGEFVTTKEKTAKHRGLLEAIHNDKQLTLLDLAPLLKGTGVGLLPDVISNTTKQMDSSALQKLYQTQKADKNIAELNENFKKFLAYQKGKPTHNIMPDGTEIYKNGSTTRIVRKRKI